MAIALVQNKAASGTTGQPGATLTSGATAGNLLVVVVWARDGNTANMTPPTGFTDRAHVATTGSGGVWPGQVMICSKKATGGETLTKCATFPGTNWEYEIYEFSGITQQGGEYDANNFTTSGAVAVTSEQPGSVTPAVTGEVFVVGQGLGGNGSAPNNGGTEAINSSFNITDAASFQSMITGYKIKTDALAENPTASWTTAGYSVIAQAAFKAVLVPDAPTGLSATPISPTRIDLSWTAPASDATHDAPVTYRVERAPDSGGVAGAFTEIAAGVGATSYSDSGGSLAANTKYWYRVRATNAGGDGAYTGNVSATTLTGSPLPRRRTSVAVIRASNI